jgi:HEAT repeat protein
MVKDKTRDYKLRKRAAEALGEMGRAASFAVPALQECLKDRDSTIRTAAEKALKRIKSD